MVFSLKSFLSLAGGVDLGLCYSRFSLLFSLKISLRRRHLALFVYNIHLLYLGINIFPLI